MFNAFERERESRFFLRNREERELKEGNENQEEKKKKFRFE